MNATYLLSIGSLDHWRRLSLQTTQLDKKTEAFKRSQNFPERNVSACLLGLHICDVIKTATSACVSEAHWRQLPIKPCGQTDC